MLADWADGANQIKNTFRQTQFVRPTSSAREKNGLIPPSPSTPNARLTIRRTQEKNGFLLLPLAIASRRAGVTDSLLCTNLFIFVRPINHTGAN